MTTSQGLDEIVLGSSPAVTSLCLALVLTTAPVMARPPHAIAAASLAEQPRCANAYTCSSSTEAPIVSELRLPLAEQLAKLFVTLSGDRDVPLLAHICNVSKNTYYGWLKGESISADNQERLARTIEFLGDVATRHHNVVAFLNSPTDVGSAADQLRAGRFDVVLGMSYGAIPALTGRTSGRGRPLRSVPFAARVATAERLRDARRVRDVVDEPNPEAYLELDEDLGSAALGSAIIVG